MTGGYALGFKISVIRCIGVVIRIMFSLSWCMKELVTHVVGLHRGRQLNPDGGWCLPHGVPHNYVEADILSCQRLLVEIVMVLVGLWGAR